MAYEVQNFENGTKLTAEQLNHMEDGIYANSANMAYEKQNFVNGQKLTAEQLNHMEAGIYANSVSSGSSGDAAVVEQATPTISVSTSGLITATATQEAGLVAAGTKSSTKQLTTQPAQTITPGTSDKTIASGRYLTGTQTIKGDANLKAENIKSGVSIFGVTGSLTTSSGGSSSGGSTTAGVAGTASFALESDVSTAGTAVKLGNVPWIAEHINDANLFAALIKKDTNTTANTICIAVGCNSNYFYGRYAAAIYKSSYMFGVSTAASGDVPFNDTTVNSCARICADANGDVYVIPYGNYFFAAAEYTLLYGLI